MAASLLLVAIAAVAGAVPQGGPVQPAANPTTYTVRLAQLNQGPGPAFASLPVPTIRSLSSASPGVFEAHSSTTSGAAKSSIGATSSYGSKQQIATAILSAQGGSAAPTALTQEATCTIGDAASSTVVTPIPNAAGEAVTPLTISGFAATCVEFTAGFLSGSSISLTTTSTDLFAPATYATNGLFNYADPGLATAPTSVATPAAGATTGPELTIAPAPAPASVVVATSTHFVFSTAGPAATGRGQPAAQVTQTAPANSAGASSKLAGGSFVGLAMMVGALCAAL